MRLHDPNLDQTTYLPEKRARWKSHLPPKATDAKPRTLTVRCNDPERPVTILKISSTIKPFVKPDRCTCVTKRSTKENPSNSLWICNVSTNFGNSGLRHPWDRRPLFQSGARFVPAHQLSVTFLGNAHGDRITEMSLSKHGAFCPTERR